MFEELRRRGEPYEDKTGVIAELAQSRIFDRLILPSGRGKSLFLSTLKAFLEGKRHLFAGLAAENVPTWSTRPVLHFDLSEKGLYADCAQSFINQMYTYLRAYGLTDDMHDEPAGFKELILAAFRYGGNQRIAILVDEENVGSIFTMKEKIGDFHPGRIDFERVAEKVLASLVRDLILAVKECSDYVHIFCSTGTGSSKLWQDVDWSELLVNEPPFWTLAEISPLQGYTQGCLHTHGCLHTPQVSRKTRFDTCGDLSPKRRRIEELIMI